MLSGILTCLYAFDATQKEPQLIELRFFVGLRRSYGEISLHVFITGQSSSSLISKICKKFVAHIWFKRLPNDFSRRTIDLRRIQRQKTPYTILFSGYYSRII